MLVEARKQIASGAAVHMSGIGGVGMAGLALLLRSRGLSVSGCDLHPGPFAEGLRAAGITVDYGHACEQSAPPVNWVIRSAAVRLEKPDIQHALSRNLPVIRRGQVLPLLVEASCPSIAVAGTHGKTTTSSLLAQLLLPLDPSWCIGGVSEAFPMPGGAGTGPLVVEADESDGTLAHYTADIALVTNVDFDHMEHFESVADFEACFAAFLGQARDCVVYCADDDRASTLALDSGGAHLGYGFSHDAEVRGFWGGKRELQVIFPDGEKVQLVLPYTLPGKHNALNLLGALAVCYRLQIPEHVWRQALATLSLPARRFEVVADTGDIQVITDYAHHPVEIRAVIRMARELHEGRLLVVFQPHRYTRTKALMDLFPAAFAGVDQLILTPVYAASEKPLPGATSEDLLRAFTADAAVVCSTVLADDLKQACALLQQDMRAGDLILVLGAGDIDQVAILLAEVIPHLNEYN